MPQSNSCLTLTSGINQVPPDIYTTNLSSQLTYNINFPYLGEDDVVVYREQPAGTFTLLTNSGTAGATPPNYTITGSNPSQVTFQTGEAPGGVSLIVGRRTDICKMLVEYQVGASIRAGDLNLDNTQLLYLIQELRSTLGELINGDDSSPIIPGQDTFRISGGTGITVTEVAGPPKSQSINVDQVTIWGQNHNHSGNVSGPMSSVGDITFSAGNRSLTTGATTNDLTIAGGTGASDGALIVNRDLELATAATTQLAGRTYTWPSGETANNVLTTDGSGNLTWGDGGSASGNLWELSGTDTRLKSATDDVLFRTGNLIKVQGTDNSSTVRTINIQAPSNDAGFTADWTLTLPDNDGNSGYVLQTNGSGVTSWVNPSSSTLWSRSGTTLTPTNPGDQVNITASDASVKIQLKANGIGTFGTIDITSDGVNGCEVRNDGLVRAQRQSTKATSAVFQGWCGTDLVSPTSQITANGSASFGGTTNVKGSKTFASGATNLAGTYSQAAFRIQTASNSSNCITVGPRSTDGSMYLQGTNNPGNATRDLYLQPYGGALYLNNQKITLKDDGSADFKGQVLVQKEGTSFQANRESGAKYFEVNQASYELTLGTGNEIILKGNDGSARFVDNKVRFTSTGNTFNKDITVTNGTGSALIKDDGSATFTGAVDGKVTITGTGAGSNAYLTLDAGSSAEAYITSTGGQSGALFFGTGSLATAQACVATNGSFQVGGTLGGTNGGNCRLNADGGAYFLNRTDIGSDTLTDVALKLQSKHTSNAGTLYVQQHGAAGKSLFQGVDGSNTIVIDLKNDGSAVFQGGVTLSDGTPNGANSFTWDVNSSKNLRLVGTQESTDQAGVLFYKEGVGAAQNNTSIYIGGDLDNATPAPNITLKADGNAEFSGTVDAAAFTVGGSPLSGGGIPAGSTMLFFNSAAPTGWTKITNQNNKALRVVSGTGGGVGGSVSFTDAFSAQSGSLTGSTGDHTLSQAQMPSHTHSGASSESLKRYEQQNTYNTTYSVPGTTGSAGSSGSHSHTITSGSFDLDLNVQYIDLILCSKD